jgi:hypothetical protein
LTCNNIHKHEVHPSCAFHFCLWTFLSSRDLCLWTIPEQEALEFCLWRFLSSRALPWTNSWAGSSRDLPLNISWGGSSRALPLKIPELC